MSKHFFDLDAERLRHLSREVSRVANSLSQLSMGVVVTPSTEADDVGRLDQVTEDTVLWLIRARRQRSRFLPEDLFAEPAWDILLDLLRAEIAQQRVSVSSLCIAAGVPATTALRYINSMASQGVIVRRSDPCDGRRAFLELSPETSQALRRYFVNVVDKKESKRV